MPRNKLALYLHLVWTTWDREPVITSEVERLLHRSMEHEAQQQGCRVVAINGTHDHVHLLVALPTTITIADLVKQLKGVSTRLVNDIVPLDSPFKWQGCYGAFTVSRWNVRKITAYIEQQKEHHEIGTLIAQLEETEEQDKAISL